MNHIATLASEPDCTSLRRDDPYDKANDDMTRRISCHYSLQLLPAFCIATQTPSISICPQHSKHVLILLCEDSSGTISAHRYHFLLQARDNVVFFCLSVRNSSGTIISRWTSQINNTSQLMLGTNTIAVMSKPRRSLRQSCRLQNVQH